MPPSIDFWCSQLCRGCSPPVLAAVLDKSVCTISLADLLDPEVCLTCRARIRHETAVFESNKELEVVSGSSSSVGTGVQADVMS